jgi:hypothetical protein
MTLVTLLSVSLVVESPLDTSRSQGDISDALLLALPFPFSSG